MLKKCNYTFSTKIFRVVPHLSQNLLFVETIHPSLQGFILYQCNLETGHKEIIIGYKEKQLLAFAANRFLIFKLYPSKILPIVKGLKVYDIPAKEYILEESEAENLECGEDYFQYEIYEKKQIIKFPYEKANHFFPKKKMENT